MSIIAISRGTFGGGKTLAECLSNNLGYRCIDRDVIVKKAAEHGVSERELLAALERPPTLRGMLDHKKYIYLALIQAALTEEVREGRAIYHGLLGHLLLKGGLGVLRLRVVAPMDFRIRMTQERLQLSRSDAIAYIEKMDQDRHKWTQYLYGVDWEDPSLYDLVVNLEHITIDEACRLVAGVTKEACFEFSPERRAAMNDLALASRVRAELALNPFTAHLEVELEARGGLVSIKGAPVDESENVRRVAMAVAGVTGLALHETAAAGGF